MLREVWRTAMLLAFASSLRVGSDGAIYLPKRLWFRGANEVAWRYDAGTLRRTETAITTVMPLVLVSFALLLLINLFAPALWILAGLALLLIAIWLETREILAIGAAALWSAPVANKPRYRVNR